MSLTLASTNDTFDELPRVVYHYHMLTIEAQTDKVHTDGHHATRDLDEIIPQRAREISAEDRARYESELAEILGALGMDLNTPGTIETPRRFLQALIDATNGYEGDPK